MTVKFRRRHLKLTIKEDVFPLGSSKDKSLSDALTEFGMALGLLAAVEVPESPESPDMTVSPSPVKRPSTPPSAAVSTYDEDIDDAEAALRQRCINERASKMARKQDQRIAEEMALRKIRADQPAPKQRKAVCKYYMDGYCSKGEDCTFLHTGQPRKQSLQEVCKFFRAGKCLKGESCPYSHDLKRVPCKFYHVWGSCAAGDGCKYSHAEFSKEELDKFFADIDKS